MWYYDSVSKWGTVCAARGRPFVLAIIANGWAAEEMAKEFAKRFYKSMTWRACRDAYYIERHGLCEECGAPGEEVHHIQPITPLNIDDCDITLNWDNLRLLCKRCHNNIHGKAEHMSHTPPKVRRYTFDCHGNLDCAEKEDAPH